MNRLWVRFSLVIGGAILVVILAPTLFRVIGLTVPGQKSAPLEGRFAAIVASLPEEALAELREAVQAELVTTLTAVAIAGAVVALLFGVWFSRSLTAPLRELEAAAQAIEAQDLGYRVRPKGSRELVAVSTAFNNMAAQLEDSENLRRNLLADVAHELRNPVHVLQGNIQAILDEVYPLNLEEVARLSDQTRLLTRLVDDLHLLSQAEAHQLPLTREPADIAVLVKETAAAYRSLASAKGVEMQVELWGTMPIVSVDVARMSQALQNLLANALRHTPEGGKIVVVVEQVAGALEIRVSDSGIGIAPEHLPYVFDRFYRTDSTRSRDTGGAGLGLAIVRAIVEEHDGRVTVSSPGANQGTTFTLSLALNSV